MTSVTYCSSALCQHPTCWEAQRLFERGLVKPQMPVPRKEPQYEALPTQQIVNLFDEICGDSTSANSHIPLSTSFRNATKDHSSVCNSTDKHYTGPHRHPESTTAPPNSCLVAAPTPESLRAIPDECNNSVSRTANKIPITSTNLVSSAAVHQLQVQEVFDAKDLRNRWKDNFTTQTYYVWVPGPHSMSRRVSKQPELQAGYNNGRPAINDILSHVKLDSVPHVSAVTRNRTILKSPRSFQLRLRAATSSVRPKTEESTTSVLTFPNRTASNRTSLPADWKSMNKKLVLRGHANYKLSAGDLSSDVYECVEQKEKIPPAVSDAVSSSRTQPLSLNTERTGSRQPPSQVAASLKPTRSEADDPQQLLQPVPAPPTVCISESGGNWKTGIIPPIPTGTAPAASMAPTGSAPTGMTQAGVARSPSSPSTHIPSAPHATPATPMVLMLPTDRLINRSVIINTELLESPDDDRTEILNISTREVGRCPAERQPFLPPLPKSAQHRRRSSKIKHRISSSPAVVERPAINPTGSPRPQSLPLNDGVVQDPALAVMGHQQSGSPLGRRSSPVRESRPATSQLELAMSPPRPASIRIIRPEPTPPPPSPDNGKDGIGGLLEPHEDDQCVTIDRGLTGVSVDQHSNEVENVDSCHLVAENQNDATAKADGTFDEAACDSDKSDKSDKNLETEAERTRVDIDANNNCDKLSSDDIGNEKNETQPLAATTYDGDVRESVTVVQETGLGKTRDSNDVESESTPCIIKLSVSYGGENTDDKDGLSDADGELEVGIAASVMSETELEIRSTELENPSAELEIPSIEPENPSTELENPSVELDIPSFENENPSAELENSENPYIELEIPFDFRQNSVMAHSTQESSRADFVNSGDYPTESIGEHFGSFAAGLQPLLTPECILVPATDSDASDDFSEPTKEDFDQELMNEYAKLSS